MINILIIVLFLVIVFHKLVAKRGSSSFITLREKFIAQTNSEEHLHATDTPPIPCFNSINWKDIHPWYYFNPEWLIKNPDNFRYHYHLYPKYSLFPFNVHYPEID